MHNREDIDEQGDAIDEGEGTEARLEGLLLLEDEGVEEHVEGAGHDARQHGGHEPGGNCQGINFSLMIRPDKFGLLG